jgi:hypothetical protein
MRQRSSKKHLKSLFKVIISSDIINNLTPADVYFGRGDTILAERKHIKRLTLLARRKEYQREMLSQSFENQNKINSFETARNSY